MIELTVRKVGNSLGVTLPAEAVLALKISAGDKVFLTSDPQGFRITPFDPAFKKKMKIALAGMKKYRDALRELAK